MYQLLSSDPSSTESDIFYVERSSEESSPIRNNTPAVLIFMELSGAIAKEIITISSVASPKDELWRLTQTLTNAQFHIGLAFNTQLCHPASMVSTCRPNLLNMLATMAVIQADEEYSPQSTELSIPSLISTPPMKASTIEGW